MNHLIEFRSYNLKPGTREEFHRLFLEAAFPLLQRWNVDVVASIGVLGSRVTLMNDGYFAHEFVPSRPDPIASLQQAFESGAEARGLDDAGRYRCHRSNALPPRSITWLGR